METLHTVSLVLPHLGPDMSELDVGCGEGWVADEIAHQGAVEVATVDVVDVRRIRGLAFSLYDGVHLPFPDGRFDVVMLNFVLHHVPNERKVALLREALRVARRTVFILEDTPSTSLDRLVSRADHTPIQIFQCNNGANQRFGMTSSGQLTFGGKCVDVAGGLPNDGSTLQLFTCKSSTDTSRFNRRFNLNGAIGNGAFCIDMPSANTNDGVGAQIFQGNGGSNQNWDLYFGL